VKARCKPGEGHFFDAQHRGNAPHPTCFALRARKSTSPRTRGEVIKSRSRGAYFFASELCFTKPSQKPPIRSSSDQSGSGWAGFITIGSGARRHCEERSDEAIQKFNVLSLDCFASLAMTKQSLAMTKQSLAMTKNKKQEAERRQTLS
jgi:hypothetical protein